MAPFESWLGTSVLYPFRKIGTENGADAFEIVPRGPFNPDFEPATFQSIVRDSTNWATGFPQIATDINNKITRD